MFEASRWPVSELQGVKQRGLVYKAAFSSCTLMLLSTHILPHTLLREGQRFTGSVGLWEEP